MPLESFAVAAPVIFVAYAVFGMTGFGAAMVAVPLLVQFYPLQFAVPLVVLFDLVCTCLVGVRNWRQVSRSELKRLFPWMLLGIGGGVTLLHSAGAKWPLMLLGTFVLAVCIKGLYSTSAKRTVPLSARWALAFGVFGGAFSAMFGTGGPIYTIYLSRRLDALDQIRATMAVIILLSAVIRSVAFGTAGLYAQPGVLSAATALLPVSLLGLFVGSRLRRHLPPEMLKRSIFILLALAGAGALYRGWLAPS